MATLQAARAVVLGLSVASAKSWGLNRAIYYAAAKRGFKGEPGRTPKAPEGARKVSEFLLGDDKAFAVRTGGKTLFTIGGEIQKPKDFRRQIEQRFGPTFRQAWDEALRIVKAHSKAVLESQQAFYMQVYRPRRDVLASKWNEQAGSAAP